MGVILIILSTMDSIKNFQQDHIWLEMIVIHKKDCQENLKITPEQKSIILYFLS